MTACRYAFLVAIQSSIFLSSTVIGSDPVINIYAWNAFGSNFGPSAAIAFILSREIASWPIL